MVAALTLVVPPSRPLIVPHSPPSNVPPNRRHCTPSSPSTAAAKLPPTSRCRAAAKLPPTSAFALPPPPQLPRCCRRRAVAKLPLTSRCRAAAAAAPPFVGWLLCCCPPSDVIACRHATGVLLHVYTFVCIWAKTSEYLAGFLAFVDLYILFVGQNRTT
jgi:hypothetical protein